MKGSTTIPIELLEDARACLEALIEWLRDLDSTQFDESGLNDLKRADNIADRLQLTIEGKDYRTWESMKKGE